MADVFISYISERRAAAEHLAEILADYGYSVWWDYALVSGKDFGAQIERELRAAKAVVVLWCGLSRESEWVKEEATLAKRLDKIVPAIIENVELPLGFTMTQTLDLATWNGAPQSEDLERLLRDIARLTGRALRPDFCEPGRYHAHRPDAEITGLGHHLDDRIGRDADNDEIGQDRAGGEIRKRRDAAHLTMVRVDGQHDPAETAVDQIAEQESSDGRRVAAGPDDCDRVRGAEAVERRANVGPAFLHATVSPFPAQES